MKILQIISSFPPAYSYGGPLQVAYNLSKNLVKQGHEVTVYSTDVLDQTHRYKNVENPGFLDGIKIFRFKNINNRLASKYRISCTPRIAYALNHNIKNYDIVHCHEYRAFEAIVMHHYAKKYHIPYIVQAHGAVLPVFEKQGIKKIYDILWGNQILRDASKLIAVSKVEKDQYLKMGMPENKIVIIPNGIDVSEYETLPEHGIFRKKYGIESDEKVILYLGRLHKSKGLDFLINTFGDLSNLDKDVKLVIVGPDDGFLNILMKQIEKLEIADKVLVTGPLYNNEKSEVFVDADVLVYPGILEIFGLVPFEAIMCGTPVIVTDDCGCGEVIKEAECGYLVKYGNIDDLREKIFKILNDDIQSNLFVRNGQKFIKDNLSWSYLIEIVKQTYLECISQSNGGKHEL